MAHAHSNHNSMCILKRPAACLKLKIGSVQWRRNLFLSPITNEKRSFNYTKPRDIASLKKDFILQFKFESNVQLDITFQRFDKDWDCFVDL